MLENVYLGFSVQVARLPVDSLHIQCSVRDKYVRREVSCHTKSADFHREECSRPRIAFIGGRRLVDHFTRASSKANGIKYLLKFRRSMMVAQVLVRVTP